MIMERDLYNFFTVHDFSNSNDKIENTLIILQNNGMLTYECRDDKFHITSNTLKWIVDYDDSYEIYCIMYSQYHNNIHIVNEYIEKNIFIEHNTDDDTILYTNDLKILFYIILTEYNLQFEECFYRELFDNNSNVD